MVGLVEKGRSGERQKTRDWGVYKGTDAKYKGPREMNRWNGAEPLTSWDYLFITYINCGLGALWCCGCGALGANEQYAVAVLIAISFYLIADQPLRDQHRFLTHIPRHSDIHVRYSDLPVLTRLTCPAIIDIHMLSYPQCPRAIRFAST